MALFSLVVATKGRTEELGRLFQSLVEQTHRDFEVIVVDQNSDDRIIPVLAGFSGKLQIKHLRCGGGVSHARNVGLSEAKGDFVAFPDDDCWYSADTLVHVAAWFEANRDYGVLTTTVFDENGFRSANKWNAEFCDLEPINIFRTTAMYTVFVRKSHWNGKVFFDETLGPASGTAYASAEDTDFVLCLMASGVKGRFTSIWHVYHPRRDMYSGQINAARALSYGLGMGRVLRKHSLYFLSVLLFGFDMVRAIKSFCVGNLESARLCWAHGEGVFRGLLAPMGN